MTYPQTIYGYNEGIDSVRQLGGNSMDWTSHHMRRIPASGTLKIFELASRLESEGRKIYHFEVGQPDFPTPPNIVEAAVEALHGGLTRYVSARGINPILDAIRDMYASRNIGVSGRKNVIVTPGAKMALFMGFLSTIDVGDDVMLLTPAWPSYRVMIEHAGGKPVDVVTDSKYTVNEESIKEKISDKTTCIVINSPNNPTGGVLSRDDLKLIYDLACDHDFVIFSDEIYESLVYEGFEQVSMLEIDPAMERTLVINGFSKAYAMTGWRLGYAIGNPETISNMVRIQQNTTSCATSFVQYAGVEALKGDQSFIGEMRASYQERRNRITEIFCSIPDVTCVNPMGAFYVFPDFSAYGIPSEELAEKILQDTGVTCTPGKIFGDHFDYNLRFSYATSIDIIEEGLTHLVKYCQTLR
ncbi:MAG: aminotransferase class I/II-fold pyridoxal phosphate-dependent enzyme [Candidatus Lokiarchaeota archaeon]|nr:aminotransferase class I/II-fold pyridoxal phosphate-dependent enzyme [Candidatus Lokiarchaeota archaeon]